METRRRWWRWCADATAIALVVSLGAVANPAKAEAAPPSWVPIQKEESVPGKAVGMTPLPAKATATAPVVNALPAPKWPAAGVASVALPTASRAATAVRAGTLPVSVAPAGKASPARVRVEVLDRAATERAGIRGLAVRFGAEKGTGTTAVTVDYGAFATAYGGDWASRLRLVPVPECALSTPDAPACQPGDPLPSRNDQRAKRVTAEVPSTGLYALAAGPSGSAGDYSASSLSPSATWQVSTQTGDFSWSYELDTPPALNGPEPDLDLTYSSQSVDGRIASTNNQTSWVGEGFNLTNGFIERRYKPCKDDGSAGTPERGDLCFAYPNATISMSGLASELIIDDATGKWRPKNDNGYRIELLTGAVNGDERDGEYWKVTATDGTQYFFGRNRLPGWSTGTKETNSAWTVPVYGNKSSEPCYSATFAEAWCQQAWRWNLDYVVDPRGNALAYFYEKETNYYARNRSTATAYTRAGYLSEIRYGLRDSAPYATAPAKVTFTVEERCKPSGTITCSDAQFTTANKGHWPDTPVDQNCKSGTTCSGMISPSFWTRKRLTAVTTHVLRGTAHDPVDTWTLRQDFITADSSSPALWLQGITHSGQVGDGSIALPEVTFAPHALPNRVDGQHDDIPPMAKYRVGAITTESGGVVSVNYSEPECVAGALPAPDANAKRCYPVRWQPEGETAQIQDWFHKYVTTQVVEDDRLADTPDEVTSYEYVGAPAWHFTDDDGLVKDKEKTWSNWRGYERVKVRKGSPTEVRSESEALYFRGMNGDRTAGGTRTALVTDSTGAALPDDPQLQGLTREEFERSGDGTEVSAKISEPWTLGPTATRTRDWGTTRSYLLNIKKVSTRVPMSGGGVRRTEAVLSYNAEGQVTEANDAGDVAVTGDEKCTRTSYARNDTTGLLALPSRVETVSVPCSVTPSRPSQVISDERIYYDNLALGAAPTRGLATSTESLTAANTYVTTGRMAYDTHGRVTEEYDALNNKATTAYTPAAGGPVTRTVMMDPLGAATTIEYEPAWGEERYTVANGRRTDFEHDALGRLTAVWTPGRTKGSQTATEEYTYTVGTNTPTVRTTRQLNDDATGYNTSYEIFDGLLRPRQTQHPATGGGRVIVDAKYDSRGMMTRKSDPYFNDQPAGSQIWSVADAQVPGQTVFVYDSADREIAEIFMVRGVEKWRTTTAYFGDRVTVDPPTGETPTMTIVDAGGQTTELRQYKGDSPTGAYDATTYTYTEEDELESVTDPAGNVRRYNYDLRGRLESTEDPDGGLTRYTYDDEDRRITSTDSRDRTIRYEYDALDRVTATYEGNTKLTENVYDTLVAGQITSSTRYVGGQAYTTAVLGYDEADRPTGTRVTIPAVEGALAGIYDFTAAYNVDGSLARITHPAKGGLPAETIRHEYDTFGMPTTTTGLTTYVTETLHSKVGDPIRQVYSTGAKSVVRTYAYEEGTRRLQRAITERDGTPLRVADVTYTYDPAGNITKISDAPDPTGLGADHQCFTYDYLRRLVEAWTPRTGECAAARSVAALGGPAAYWHSFSYDAVGNRTKEVQHAAAGDTTRTYTTPPARAARPHTLTSVATTGPSGNRTDTFEYDAAGNTTKRVVNGATQALEWDAEGNLTKVTEGSRATSYLYDAGGNRLIRRDPTGTTLYLGDMELRLANGQVSGLRYYQHGGDVAAVRSSQNGVSFLFSDHHDTDEMSIDAETMAVSQRWHDPFGAPRGPQPASWAGGDRGYVGGTHDASTGLVHLGARMYDPAIGRFISLDPLVEVDDPQTMHGYAYANNSPETFTDPDGLSWWCPSWCKRAKEAAARKWREWKAWLAWKAWKARYDAWRRWVAQQAAKAKAAARKAKQLARKTYHRARKAVSKATRWVGKQVKKHVRTFKQGVKRLAKGAGKVWKGTKAAWKATKSAARTVGKWGKAAWENAGPGSRAWTIAKVVVGAVALATCAICTIAAGVMFAMTVVDLGAHTYQATVEGKKGAWLDMGLDVVGIGGFLGARYAARGLAEADNIARLARNMRSETRIIRDSAERSAGAFRKAAKVISRVDAGGFTLGTAKDAGTCNWSSATC